MNTNFFTLLVTCLIAATVFSQTSLNQYKYVIVQKQYNFLKEPNQYQLNALTKFLFEKYNFETLMEGTDYPEDLAKNRCLALNADISKDSGLFNTKLKVALNDCNDKTVFTSKEGESREKDYKTAYHQALREAFESIAALDYKYEPGKNIVATVQPSNTDNNEEVERLKKEVAVLKQKELKQKEIEEKLASKGFSQTTDSKRVRVQTKLPATQTLYAQETENGFQLVDRTPKVVYKIKKTGRENLFLVEDQDAIIYKLADKWVYEYNTDEGLKQVELNIKF